MLGPDLVFNAEMDRKWVGAAAGNITDREIRSRFYHSLGRAHRARQDDYRYIMTILGFWYNPAIMEWYRGGRQVSDDILLTLFFKNPPMVLSHQSPTQVAMPFLPNVKLSGQN